MTEVDISIPEATAITANIQSPETASGEQQQRQNGSKNPSLQIINHKNAAMGDDDDEEDSQISSSTDTGGDGPKDGDENSDGNSRQGLAAKTAGNLNGDSNACESVSQNCDSGNSSECKNQSNHARDSENDTNKNDSNQKLKPHAEDDEGVGVKSYEGSTNHIDEISNENYNPVSDGISKINKNQKESTSTEEKQSKNESPSTKNNNNNGSTSIEDRDSDEGVVIGSYSENECEKQILLSPTSIKTTPLPAPPIPAVEDDDDDDCVVIEDDTPAPNDLSKRKVDASSINDDSTQPPNKRQRNSLPATPVQLTNKDPQSLMTTTPELLTKSSHINPVNIAPVLSPGPPTVVSVGSPMSAFSANISTLGGVPGINSTFNANLLSVLTDDMFVLEAPSFIVPYIYEKPPAYQIRVVVQELHEKFNFSKEDLEVDKTDEFVMMTDQNKDDRKETNAKKKKARGAYDDDDESWSEEEEDSDDYDDSESEVSDDICATNTAFDKLGQENYFESPLGKFFMDIGVGLVQEHVQNDLICLQKLKMRKSLGRKASDFEKAIKALTAYMEASKEKNAPFKFNMNQCKVCNFKSESALSMANHYEKPHMNGQLYKCNFCVFEIQNATEIVYHMEAEHNIKTSLIEPLPYHQCPNCEFEDNDKANLARHQPVCARIFRPEINLAPPSDWEAPAKILRIQTRQGLVGTVVAYQAMVAQEAAEKAALASIYKFPPPGMNPGQNPTDGKAQFVICEICNGYSENLEQLRNHMQRIHQVK